MYVVVLSKIERLLTNGALLIHLLKLMPYIFLLVIMPNLLSK